MNDVSRPQIDFGKVPDNVEEQYEIIKNEFLADYINGYTTYKDIDERLNAYGIYPSFKYYFVVSVFVKDYGILRYDAQKDTSFVINNVLEDLLGMDNVYRTRVNGMLVYIINCENDDTAKRQEVIDLFEEANRLTKNILEISFIAGISGIRAGFESLPKLFEESATVIGYARFYDTDKFVCYDEINHEYSKQGPKQRNFAKETELILNIKAGKIRTIRDIIDSMFESAGGVLGEKWYYQGLAYNIINSMLSLMETFSESTCQKIIAEAHKLGSDPTITEIKNMLYIIGEIAGTFFKDEADMVDGVYAMTRRYIDQHYADHNLDITTLGQALEMTGFYISRVFKMQSGMKVSVYINKLRVAKAKSVLLEDKEIKIADVGYSVGFDNQRTFLKAFKEIEGITPTQYRNTYSK